jgi:hypothetical protein
MKLKSVPWIVFAIPGTFIEISVRIVRKDMSLRRPQRYWINTDRARFINIIPGRKAVFITDMDLVSEAASWAVAFET